MLERRLSQIMCDVKMHSEQVQGRYVSADANRLSWKQTLEILSS